MDGTRKLELAVENATHSPRETHAELLDPGSRDVWLSRDPLSREAYEALRPPAPLVKSGFGRGAMDRAWFRSSPGVAEDSPLCTREIDGRVFQLVARPDLAGAARSPADEPRRLSVEKRHVIVFAAGRTVPLLESDDGRCYAPLVAPRRGELRLPDGWSLRELSLDEDWQVELPCPTETLWFANGASFQGPVSPPAEATGRAPDQ